ncbi:FAD-dependent oxidoreductase [Embleya sp. NPDC005575]|uniref:NAD(P)/FAD-dependent oxidoreductase n=1 Tax=Embleya sp. NPDC005575 TaxID=3156892 RepID=UPI0033ADBC7A
MADVDVSVVGTGVIGLATALELLDRGLTVAVVGPRRGDHAGQATRAAGAMLSTFSEVEPHHGSDRVRVETAERLAAHEMYPAWLDRLRTNTGATVHAGRGTWVLAAAGERPHLDAVARTARAAGHPAEHHPPTAITAVSAPDTGAGALWLPTEAWLDSATLMDALTTAVADHRAATWHDRPARSVTHDGVLCADGTRIRAPRTVLAAGTATPSLLPDAGHDLGIPPILAGRGASITLRRPRPGEPGHVVRTPNAAFACGVHLVPRADDTLYLGGTNRLTTRPDPDVPATLDELSVLIHGARTRLDPALVFAHLLSTRVGLRPYTVDHLPLIGPTHDPRIVLATATYRCGILLAPRIAHLIADEITTPGTLDDHPYRANRPMPIPDLATILDDGAGQALVEHLTQDGTTLPPHAARELAAFAVAGLRALADHDSPHGRAIRRLWNTAPVIEAVPSLHALARRLETTP